MPHAGWVGVAGPSGSGKTRLLRAIAGLCDADAGEFRLRGTDRREMAYPEWRRRVSYVGQRAVFLKGTVLFNLERPFAYASVRARFDVAGVARALERLRLLRPYRSRTRAVSRSASSSGCSVPERGALPIGVAQLGMAALLVLCAGAVSVGMRLRLERTLAVASLRTVLQLWRGRILSRQSGIRSWSCS